MVSWTKNLSTKQKISFTCGSKNSNLRTKCISVNLIFFDQKDVQVKRVVDSEPRTNEIPRESVLRSPKEKEGDSQFRRPRKKLKDPPLPQSPLPPISDH